jgi:hypothetical protein
MAVTVHGSNSGSTPDIPTSTFDVLPILLLLYNYSSLFFLFSPLYISLPPHLLLPLSAYTYTHLEG